MGKKSKKRDYSSDSEEEMKIKKSKKSKKSKHKSKKKKRRESSSEEGNSSSNSEEAGWVVKNIEDKPKEVVNKEVSEPIRDDWMTTSDAFSLKTFSKEKKTEKKPVDANYEVYNPATNPRELNPYFKTGEGGLPTSQSQFQRPRDYDDDDNSGDRRTSHYSRSSSSSTTARQSWRKSIPNERERSRSKSPEVKRVMLPAKPPPDQINESSSLSHSDYLSDTQMNEIGAKIIKAELMGNTKLLEKLKDKLERAKEYKKNNKNQPQKAKEQEQVLLTLPTASGMNRPIREGEKRDKRTEKDKKKNKRVETHEGGERTRYYADDDKYDIKQMFEHEKFSDGRDQDIEFAKAISKVKESQQMDMADIFSDTIRKDKTKKTDERDDAIREAQKMEKVLDTCHKCFDSPKMNKDLIVYVGKTIYLAIPHHEALVPHHLVISTIQHVPCTTMIDEEVWEEFKNLKKALTKFFFDRNEDVVFFETVKYLHRRPHMEVQLIANKEFEMIQFYFKKAIQESEKLTMNKKLVDIKSDKSIRSSIPRGLPYFWIDFGNTGMAHVIENQEEFPYNFAQEIIGGMLNLDVNRWRRPRKELQPTKRTQYFNNLLKKVLENFQ